MKNLDNNSFSNSLDNIQKVELTLLNGQVELVLRALELYGYNLDYMLNSESSSNEDDLRQEKSAMLKFTYEQIQSTQAEQVNGKSSNNGNNSKLAQNMHSKDNILEIIPKNKKIG